MATKTYKRITAYSSVFGGPHDTFTVRRARHPPFHFAEMKRSGSPKRK